ncbi:MAG: hypothetical protein IRY85_12815 [Micromonosporaceae bacterium]|nr:hypothetical protein [Micromonosporaceae bacterium]
MGRLTLAAVRAGDPEAFRSAALAWAALAAALDAASEHMATGRARVGAAGQGTALAVAADRVGTEVRAVGGAVGPARRIAQALLRHADALAALQRHLDAVLATARSTGLTVDLVSGTVTAAGPAGVAPWRATVDAVRDELAEILAQARRLDAATAVAVGCSPPDQRASEPDQWAAGDASRLDRATVQRQADRAPADVAAWWRSLSPHQREWALRDHPDLIGHLDGIPAVDRDRANRTHLDHLVAQAAAPAGLRAVRDQLAATPEAYLLLIDGSGDGRVAVALGAPDHARHTALFVPGVGTDLLDIHGELARTATLRRVADQTTVAHGDVSVVYWLGYDPPDSLLDGWREGPSRDGGAALTRFADGLRASHVGGPSHVTALGHSYGSTVVAEGARAGGLRVDDIVVVGSPGLHSDHARELNLDPRHVWVGRSATDEIRFVPGPIHGREPADPGFGANRFVTDTSGHSGYWRPDSDSLLNQAYIVTGQYDRVTLVHGERPA